jgi:[acyl-carrier-protein] S-malonyltransferase
MPDIVLLCPGQGSQAAGMGKELAARFSAAREVFEAADEAIGAPLSHLCFEGPDEELTLTHNAQPAIRSASSARITPPMPSRCPRRCDWCAAAAN